MALFIDRIEACVTYDVQAEEQERRLFIENFNSCVAFCLIIDRGPKFYGGLFELIRNFHQKFERK